MKENVQKEYDRILECNYEKIFKTLYKSVCECFRENEKPFTSILYPTFEMLCEDENLSPYEHLEMAEEFYKDNIEYAYEDMREARYLRTC